MAKRIATVSGTAIAPGVSRNGRLYTRENIAKAYTRAKTRIGEGARPISMRTHHAAGDDSTRIVGQVTEMTLQPDGSVKYRADIADTVHGRDIADLVDPEGGTPFLKGVSIRGAWLGRVRRQSGPDGGLVETADDLEITGLDYTAEPGVDVADVADFKRIGDDAAETEERVLIYESVQEALVETATAEETTEAVPVTEAADPAKPFGDVIYADPGYQADKKKRYPLDTKAHVKSAWSYISQADNAKAYTAAQLKRIKGRIKPALKRFGVQIAAENWLIDTAAVAETVTEHMGVGTPEGTFCLSATNGPLSITMSSYCIDPADMELILHAVADAAAAALKSVDPDMDGDMDVPGAPGEDTDSDTETAESVAETGDEPAPEPPAVPEPAEATEDPAPDPAAVPQKEEEEPAVSEPTTQAVVPTPAATDKPAETNAMEALNAKFDTLTGAITDLVGKLTPAPAVATESAPAAVAPAQETVPAAVEETQEQMIARLVAEGVAAERTRIVQETVEATGGPSRKGLVAPVTEHSAPAATEGWPEGWPTENGDPKPLHKWNDNERSQHMGPAIEQYVLGARAR